MSGQTIDYDALAKKYGGTSQPDYDALAAKYGGTPVPAQAPDTRNAIQKEFDTLATVTPQQEQGHSWLTNKAQEFGAGVIQALGAPIVHPEQTLAGIANTVAHPIDTAEAMAKQAYHNPAQTAGNVVGGALMGEAAAPAADAANTVVSRVGGRAALLGKTPEAAYESALKPSTTLTEAERTNLAKTGLENAIPVSKGGLQKIADRIEELNQKIADQIGQDPNRPIDPNAVALRTNDTLNRFGNQVVAEPDLQAIRNTRDQFLRERGAADTNPAPSMPAAQAQNMKTGTYRILRGKYGEQGSAVIEAQKDLARGLKEEIASQFPEINNLNATESKLLDLQPVLERAVARKGNHQLIGIGTPVAGAAAKAVTGNGPLAAATMALKAVLDDPMLKSRLAIAVSKGAKIPYARAAARVAAYSAALQPTASGPQAYSSGGNPTQPTNAQP